MIELSSIQTTQKIYLLFSDRDQENFSDRQMGILRDGALWFRYSEDGAGIHAYGVTFLDEALPEVHDREVLVLVGADPMLFPPPVLRAMAAAWPGTEIGPGQGEVFEAEAHHFLAELQRQDVPGLLQGFLDFREDASP